MRTGGEGGTRKENRKIKLRKKKKGKDGKERRERARLGGGGRISLQNKEN